MIPLSPNSEKVLRQLEDWPWAPWALVLALLAVGLSSWHPLPPGIWHDDGVYVLLGRSLAEGDGLRYQGVPGAPLAPKFPPLFPFLLALVWWVFPSFPENIPVLGGVNVVLMAVAGGLFSVYLRKVLGIPYRFSLFLTAFFWLSAHLWRIAAVPLSEPLFLVGLILALGAGGRMESKRGPLGVSLFLLAASVAVFARTLGVAVLGAGVVTLILAGRRKAAAGALAGGGLLLAPWALWSWRATRAIPSTLQDILGSYSGWLIDQIREQPLGFLEFVGGNAIHLGTRTLSLLMPGVTGPALFFGLILFPVLLLGLWELYCRSKLLPLTLLFSLGILLIWPFQEIRLLVPFQPILFLAVAMGFWRILESSGLPRRLRIPTSGLALAWVLIFLSVSIVRLAGGWTTEAYRIRSEALLSATRAVTEKTPLDAVVGAPELWAGLHLFSGRTVVPSARFRPLAAGGFVSGTPQDQYEIWIASGVTHLLVEHGGLVHGDALDRIDALCPAGSVQVLDSQPGRYLVSLGWDAACQEKVLAN